MFNQCDMSGACPSLMFLAGVCFVISGGVIPLFVMVGFHLRDTLRASQISSQPHFKATELKHAV